MDPASLSAASFEEIQELLLGDGLRRIEAQLGARDLELQAEIAALRERLDERFRVFATDVETRIARLEEHLGETREAGDATKREAEAATTTLRDQIVEELTHIRTEAKEALRSMQEQVVGRGDLSSALERIAKTLRGQPSPPAPDPTTPDQTAPDQTAPDKKSGDRGGSTPPPPWKPDEDAQL